MLKYMLLLTVLLCVQLVSPIKDPVQQSGIYRTGIDFRSYGGNTADIKDHRYTVAIYNELYEFLIGAGGIINRYWISLAAFSINKALLPSVIVRAGSNDAMRGGQRRTISKFIIHEKYRHRFEYMLALIKLSEPLQFNDYVGSVKIANATPAVNSEAVLTGYGDLYQINYFLKNASVSVLTPGNCPVQSDYCFCADAPGIGPCSNDKGAPLVQNGYLIGHFLGGDNCNMFGTPEVYSNIAAYKDWIINTVKNNSNRDEMEGIV